MAMAPSLLMLARAFLVAIAYAVTGTLSLQLAIPPGNACSVWPAAAIAVCACMRWGLPMAPGVWLGATAVNLETSVPAWTAGVIGVGNSLEAVAATLLLRRFLGPVPALMRGEDAFRFAAIAAGSSLVAANVGVLAMLASGRLPMQWVEVNWLTWWLGDTTSILIAAPLLLTMHDWFAHRWTRARRIEFALFLLALAALAYILFDGPPTPWLKPYMLLPFVIFAAFRFGLGGVSSVVAFVAAAATLGVLRDHGPFVPVAESLNEALIYLQIYISVLGIAGIALAALLAQRQRIEQDLRKERDALELRVAERTAALSLDIDARKAVEQQLQESNQRYRSVVELSPDGILIINHASRFVLVNRCAAELCGAADQAALLGQSVFGRFAPPFDTTLLAILHESQKNGPIPTTEEVLIRLDGGRVDVEAHCARIEFGGEPAILVIVRDISARKGEDMSRRLAAQVFEHSPEGIVIADAARRILSVNQAHASISGFSGTDVVGKAIGHAHPAQDGNALMEAIWHTVDRTGEWQGELVRLRQNGQAYPSWTSIVAVRNATGALAHYIEIFADISERKDAESKIRFLAEHDFLTGLPSRKVMLDRLGQAIATVQRNGGALALLFIDLDHFKEINDANGHGTGDKLLQAVAARLLQGLRSVDTVCRQGGDEFVVILADADTLEHVAHVAASLSHRLAAPLVIDGLDIALTASIGIAIFPSDARDISMLIKHADVAMYHAKQSGGGQYKFFNSDMNKRINERLALEASLKTAIAKQQFVLEYQPEISMASGQATAVEALVRWQHPQHGLLLPGHFIGTSEDTGMIVPIGDWVLRTACRQARAWHDMGLPITMSVNLSVAQFRQKNLLRSVRDALKGSALEARFLELEITESILVDSAESTLATLQALHGLGVRIAIDDFGTGYSSLSYLKRFKVDKIKIDQSFVRDIGTDHDDAAIVSAIVSMARKLNLTVLAEGVETKEQFAFLAALGCDEYQGFYASKALPADDFAQFKVSH